MNGGPQAKVLLATLSVRTSGKGTAYLSGWLGKAQVIAFAGEPDKFGNPTWNLFLSEPASRDNPPGRSVTPPARNAP